MIGIATETGRPTLNDSSSLVLVKNPDTLVHGSPVAKMYVSGRGGGIRRLIGGTHRHVIAMRRDPQMAFGQPVEGVVEGPAMIRCATDPDVVHYQFQPFRLVFADGGRLCEWICDVLYVTIDGTVWVREIKRSAKDLLDPEYAAKLECAAALLARLGWKFAPWLRAEIEGSPERQVNAATIYFDRAASLGDTVERFDKIRARTSVMTFGELIAALDPEHPNRARAAAHRLIMMGRVWADLDILLEDWSEVHLRPIPDIAVELPFA